MLTAINPKLPMRDKLITRSFYLNQLGFEDIGSADFEDYLILKKDAVAFQNFRTSEFQNFRISEIQ